MSMYPPTAELERLIKRREFHHGGHPVLTWNARNVTVRKDPAGSIKPDKEKSTERIDGIVAVINALGRAMGGDTGETVVPDGYYDDDDQVDDAAAPDAAADDAVMIAG